MSTTRIQLALNVDDVSAATAFYEKMFGVPPHKVRDGYANFAIEDPPLKLVLIEKPGATERLNHLGVEAATPLTCRGAAALRGAGLETTVAEQDVCCHATQDKVFVDRAGRAARLVGVLQHQRRQPGQPGRRNELGVRDELRGPGQRREHLLRYIGRP